MNDSFGDYQIFSGNGGLPPRVSVVMSVYNGESYLRRSIESILGQTFRDFEFIIVDDGSADRTADILKEYRQKDSRVVVIVNAENIGLTKSLVRAIGHARGAIIARQDADDYSDKKRFEEQMKYIPDYDFVCSRSRLNGRRTFPHPLVCMFHSVFIRYRNPFVHGTFLFKKELYDRVGGYDPNILLAQDYDLVFRLIKAKTRFKYLLRSLYYSIKSDACISLGMKKKQQFQARMIQKEHQL